MRASENALLIAVVASTRLVPHVIAQLTRPFEDVRFAAYQLILALAQWSFGATVCMHCCVPILIVMSLQVLVLQPGFVEFVLDRSVMSDHNTMTIRYNIIQARDALLVVY